MHLTSLHCWHINFITETADHEHNVTSKQNKVHKQSLSLPVYLCISLNIILEHI